MRSHAFPMSSSVADIVGRLDLGSSLMLLVQELERVKKKARKSLIVKVILAYLLLQYIQLIT